jgi:ketosteroid isomerase-like protein
MASRFALAALLVLGAGCSQSSNDAKSEILAADKAFCAKSVKDGAQAAFVEFCAGDAKLLSSPKQGRSAVLEAFRDLPKTASLTWDTAFVDVAASGDLGYTWGRYTLLVPSAKLGRPPFVRKGTYATIWRKESGRWKVVLDGGNPDG